MMKEQSFQGLGGKIFYRTWQPASPPRAVVAIAHGVLSHSGYYEWTGTQLAARGFAVFAIDHRGRGRSDGERYFIEKVDDYVSDLASMIDIAKGAFPGLPVYLLGHSAGGVISCVYTLEHQREIAGLICESFAFKVYAPDLALAVVKGLSHIAPHLHVLKLPIEGFSRDPKVVETMKQDPLLANEVQPSQTVAALVRADERLEKEFPLIELPVLILHGKADIVTNPKGSQFFFDTVGSKDKTLKLYDDYFHDLLADVGKEAVLEDIVAWIGARIPR
jgi:acylglycerol lipase